MDNQTENSTIITRASRTAQAPVSPVVRRLIVHTSHLTKQYGAFVALSDLNLAIERGSIYGFIGPNGAGKTTTMRILSTLLAPSSGQAWVSGYPVTEEPYEVRRRIGYMPDFFGVYDNMKVWEYLDFFAASYNVPANRRKALTDDLLALVDLTVKRDSFVEDLSRGMKQRLCLARTLVHEPDLLILDEPASGLDPRARIELRELLRELQRLGKTILVSSHILTELAEMCTHVGIIERGRLLESGRVSDILQRLQPAREIHIKVLARAAEAVALLEKLHGVLSIRLDDGSGVRGQGSEARPDGATPKSEMAFGTNPKSEIVVRVDGNDALLGEMLSQLVSAGIPVFGFGETVGNLEDIFLSTTKGLVQ
ncbi:MAG TPA: ABC transporter ATP-binding protein [Chloroflexia bacterium]|nr:ABC transporter ATP-binding protein [Chloroflexia bacterium]